MTAIDASTAVKGLSALAQATRLAIFRLLVQRGPDGCAVGEIATALDLAAATLSFHLKELSHAGLIVARNEGRFIYYSPDFEAMNALLGFLTDNCCAGADCGVNDVSACKPKAIKRSPVAASRTKRVIA